MDDAERQQRILAGARSLALWAEVNNIADTTWAEADADAARDRLYPLAAGAGMYLMGDGHGTIACGLGPFHADPAPFTLQALPPKTYIWRYIEPPPRFPISMLDAEAASPFGPALKTHDVALQQWAIAEGRRYISSWWVGWAPELARYVLWTERG